MYNSENYGSFFKKLKKPDKSVIPACLTAGRLVWNDI
jgi:hypothetical protein